MAPSAATRRALRGPSPRRPRAGRSAWSRAAPSLGAGTTDATASSFRRRATSSATSVRSRARRPRRRAPTAAPFSRGQRRATGTCSTTSAGSSSAETRDYIPREHEEKKKRQRQQQQPTTADSQPRQPAAAGVWCGRVSDHARKSATRWPQISPNAPALTDFPAIHVRSILGGPPSAIPAHCLPARHSSVKGYRG